MDTEHRQLHKGGRGHLDHQVCCPDPLSEQQRLRDSPPLGVKGAQGAQVSADLHKQSPGKMGRSDRAGSHCGWDTGRNVGW